MSCFPIITRFDLAQRRMARRKLLYCNYFLLLCLFTVLNCTRAQLQFGNRGYVCLILVTYGYTYILTVYMLLHAVYVQWQNSIKYRGQLKHKMDLELYMRIEPAKCLFVVQVFRKLEMHASVSIIKGICKHALWVYRTIFIMGLSSQPQLIWCILKGDPETSIRPSMFLYATGHWDIVMITLIITITCRL